MGGGEFDISFQPYLRYATFKINFRKAWYLASEDNKKIWHEYMQECLKLLKPMHAYSGFEVATAPMGHIGAVVYSSLEKICSEYFYGLDIDHPFRMAYHNHFDTTGYIDHSSLDAGIRTPVWSFLLAPYWLKKLNKSVREIEIYFKDFPEVVLTQIEYPLQQTGLWIQLGNLSLYPIEDGLPSILVHANKLIQPIRCDYLQLTIFDVWEDDPNPYFNYETGIAWMRRFDIEDHQEVNVHVLEEQIETLRLYPEEICPRTGWWIAPNLMGKKQYIREGEKPLGPIKTKDGNHVIWYWRANENI